MDEYLFTVEKLCSYYNCQLAEKKQWVISQRKPGFPVVFNLLLKIKTIARYSACLVYTGDNLKPWLGDARGHPPAFSGFVEMGVCQQRVVVKPPSTLVQCLWKCLR